MPIRLCGFIICAQCTLLVLACSEEQGGPLKGGDPATTQQGPVVPKPQFQLQPADLVTSFGNSPILLTVRELKAPLTTVQVQSITSNIELVTYPEGVSVSADFSFSNKTALVDAIHCSVIDIKPLSKLQTRWYGLRFSPPSWMSSVVGSSNARVNSSGVHESRFHTGSMPIMRMVSICPKKPGLKTVVVDFSERTQVINGGSALSLLSVESVSGKQTCNSVGAVGVDFQKVVMECIVKDGEDLDVVLKPGFVSTAGVAVGTVSGKKTAKLSFAGAASNDCVTKWFD